MKAASGGGFPLSIEDKAHPVGRALSSLDARLLDEARVRQLVGATPLPGARTILRAGDRPLLVEKDVGRGHVLLFTSSADRSWTNVPVHPAFPILLHEAVTCVTRRSYEEPFSVEDPLIASLPRDVMAMNVVFRAPGGEAFPVAVTQEDGARFAEYGGRRVPGFYEVAAGNGAAPISLASNVSTSESAIEVLGGEGLKAALADLPVRVQEEGEDLRAMITEGRVGREMWRTILLLALAVFVLEGYLARRFSRRMRAPAVRSS